MDFDEEFMTLKEGILLLFEDEKQQYTEKRVSLVSEAGCVILYYSHVKNKSFETANFLSIVGCILNQHIEQNNNLNFELIVSNNYSLKFQCHSHEDKQSWIKQISVYTTPLQNNNSNNNNNNSSSTSTHVKSRGISLPDVKVEHSSVHHRNFNQSAPSLISVATNSVRDFVKDDQIEPHSYSYQDNQNLSEGDDEEESDESDEEVSNNSDQDDEESEDQDEEEESDQEETYSESEDNYYQQQQQLQLNRDLNEDESFIIELFPTVEVSVILDALDFCGGDRDEVIALLASQTRLSFQGDLNAFSPIDTKRKSSLNQHLRQQQHERERKQEQLNKEQRELKKELKKEIKQFKLQEKQFEKQQSSAQSSSVQQPQSPTSIRRKQSSITIIKNKSTSSSPTTAAAITNKPQLNSYESTSSTASLTAFSPSLIWQPQSNRTVVVTTNTQDTLSDDGTTTGSLEDEVSFEHHHSLRDSQNGATVTIEPPSFVSLNISSNSNSSSTGTNNCNSINNSNRSRRRDSNISGSGKSTNNCNITSTTQSTQSLSTPSLPLFSQQAQHQQAQQIKKTNWSYKPSAQQLSPTTSTLSSSSISSSNTTATAGSSLSSSQERPTSTTNTSYYSGGGSSTGGSLTSSQDRSLNYNSNSNGGSGSLTSSQERPITPSSPTTTLSSPQSPLRSSLTSSQERPTTPTNGWKSSSKSGVAWDLSIKINGFFQLDDGHIEYRLHVISNSNEWFVFRRYNNFLMLDKKLKSLGMIDKKDQYLILPPKKLKVSSSNQVAKSRQEPLQSYLVHLLSNYQGIFYNNNIVNVFLNSEVDSTLFQQFINKL